MSAVHEDTGFIRVLGHFAVVLMSDPDADVLSRELEILHDTMGEMDRLHVLVAQDWRKIYERGLKRRDELSSGRHQAR